MEVRGADGARIEAPSVFREPDFVRLWIAGLAIFSVRWIEALVISVFVYQRTGSEFLVAMMMMWRVLPMCLFGAFLGAWSERVERHRALLAVLVASLAMSLSITILALTGQLEIWHLGVASFVNGIGWASDNPIRRYLLGQVVGASRLGAAMSIDVGSNNASRVLGPSLGGLLIVAFGIEGAFFFGALIYLVGIGAVAGLRVRNVSEAGAAPNLLRHIASGWAEVRTNEQLRAIFALTFLYNIFGWPTLSLVPVIGSATLHLDTYWIGILTSADGVGTLVGALLIGWLAPPPWFGRLYVGGLSIFCAMMALVPTSGEPIAAGVFLVLVGLGGAGFAIMQSTLVFIATPVILRGAILGLLTVCIGVAPLGLILLGTVAKAIGAAATMQIFSIAGLAAIAATFPVWKPLCFREDGSS